MMINKYDIALSYAVEQENMVDTVYHYLKSEGLSVFFAPECQEVLVGMNQREIFYKVFSKSKFVALFISNDYINKKTPMEEANIAFTNHEAGFVIPVYLDDSHLPVEMLDPNKINYYKSNNPAEITKIIKESVYSKKSTVESTFSSFEDVASGNNVFKNNTIMSNNNVAQNQQIIQNTVLYGDNKNN